MSQDVAIDFLLVDDLHRIALQVCLLVTEHCETHIALRETNNAVPALSQHLPQRKVIVDASNATQGGTTVDSLDQEFAHLDTLDPHILHSNMTKGQQPAPLVTRHRECTTDPLCSGGQKRKTVGSICFPGRCDSRP